MNASFHVLDEILEAFESNSEASLFEKYSSRYTKDFELQKLSKLYNEFLDSKEASKRDLVKHKLGSLHAARKYEHSGGGKLPLKDRRRQDSKFSYSHDEE